MPASMYNMLHKAQPLWSSADLYKVCTKLQKVGVSDAESLSLAVSEGELNSKLADAGERKLKESTLSQLRVVLRETCRATMLTEQASNPIAAPRCFCDRCLAWQQPQATLNWRSGQRAAAPGAPGAQDLGKRQLRNRQLARRTALQMAETLINAGERTLAAVAAARPGPQRTASEPAFKQVRSCPSPTSAATERGGEADPLDVDVMSMPRRTFTLELVPAAEDGMRRDDDALHKLLMQAERHLKKGSVPPCPAAAAPAPAPAPPWGCAPPPKAAAPAALAASRAALEEAALLQSAAQLGLFGGRALDPQPDLGVVPEEEEEEVQVTISGTVPEEQEGSSEASGRSHDLVQATWTSTSFFAETRASGWTVERQDLGTASTVGFGRLTCDSGGSVLVRFDGLRFLPSEYVSGILRADRRGPLDDPRHALLDARGRAANGPAARGGAGPVGAAGAAAVGRGGAGEARGGVPNVSSLARSCKSCQHIFAAQPPPHCPAHSRRPPTGPLLAHELARPLQQHRARLINAYK